MIFLHNVQFETACKASVLTLLITTLHTAHSAALFDSTDFNAVIEAEWAVTKNNSEKKSYNTQKSELIFAPEADISISDNTGLYVLGRLRVDAQNNISPDDSHQAELREFYIDSKLADTGFIVGKQQIVWGKADGLKVLDVVNPQDFREFILDDFDQSRIPLWSVNIETEFNNATLQLIFIPEQTYHKFADNNGIYQFTSPLIIPSTPPGADVIINPTVTPDRIFADADWGARISSFWHGWDLTLNYLYHYNDTPVLFRHINSTASGLEITINPEYKRSHLLGTTFSNSFGDFTLRGELGYSTDRYASTLNLSDSDGVIKTAELSYVLGFDWFGLRDTFISFQLFQTYLKNHPQGMIRPDRSTQTTFLIKNEYLNDTLSAEALLIHDVDIDDGLIRPKLNYELNNEIIISTGADIFYGNKNGIFGQFKDTDRIFFNITIGL